MERGKREKGCRSQAGGSHLPRDPSLTTIQRSVGTKSWDQSRITHGENTATVTMEKQCPGISEERLYQ